MHNSLAEWLLYCIFIQPQYIIKWQSQIRIKAFVIKLSVLRKNSSLLTFVKDLGDFIFNFKVLALIAVQNEYLTCTSKQYSVAYRRPLDGWADRCSAEETFLFCLKRGFELADMFCSSPIDKGLLSLSVQTTSCYDHS